MINKCICYDFSIMVVRIVEKGRVCASQKLRYFSRLVVKKNKKTVFFYIFLLNGGVVG